MVIIVQRKLFCEISHLLIEFLQLQKAAPQVQLAIVEHHHHDGVDLFPDFHRQVPFGVGTSILHNYLDYRIKNKTDNAFQISTSIQGEYLCGTLYAENPIDQRYHIKVEDEKFVLEENEV